MNSKSLIEKEVKDSVAKSYLDYNENMVTVDVDVSAEYRRGILKTVINDTTGILYMLDTRKDESININLTQDKVNDTIYFYAGF